MSTVRLLSDGGPARTGGVRAEPEPNVRRWIALSFIALAQLMVALDATIVSIALPSAQTALAVSDAQRQWMITAYTLPFGGLLVLGGRIADCVGRKRGFLVGLIGFAAASALGGAAPNLGMLMAARALQGTFAALLAPTALSLLAVTFTESHERAKAFAVYGAIAGSGGALGLILGGALTEQLDWRWCLYVNVPIAVVAAAGAWLVLADTRVAGRPRLDVLGALLVTGGLGALVYACAAALADGWGSARVVGALIPGVGLLGLFAVRESRVDEPLLPPWILLDRSRGGAYLCVALAVAGMFGVFLLLTYYLQVVLGYSPLKAGLAFLPLTTAALFSSGAIASRWLPLVPPRALMVPGLLVAASGMAVLTQLQVDSGYASHVLPGEILLGLGMGCVMVPAISTATHRVGPRDAGIASAVVNAAQQVGGSIGAALLNTVAASATTSYLASRLPSPPIITEGLVHGYAIATAWGAGIFAVAAVLAAVLIDAPKPARPATSDHLP